MNKYYLILYEWLKYNRYGSKWNRTNKLISGHPLKYLRKLKTHFKEDDEGNKYDYVLLWYTEVSREHYELYKDEL